jgi:hypothetical protein
MGDTNQSIGLGVADWTADVEPAISTRHTTGV